MTYIVLTKETRSFHHQGVLHWSEEFRRPQLVATREKASEVAGSEYFYSKYYSVHAKFFKKEVVEEYYDTFGDEFLEELWRESKKPIDPNPMFYWL